MALIENPRPDVYGGVRVEDGWVRGFTQSGLRRAELPLHRRAGGPGARVPGARGRRAGRIGDGPVPAAHSRERPVDPRIRRRRAVQRHRHPGRLLADVAAARRRGRRSTGRQSGSFGRSDGDGGAHRRLGRRHDRQKLHARGVHRMRRRPTCQRERATGARRWCPMPDSPFGRTSASRAPCCCGRFEGRDRSFRGDGAGCGHFHPGSTL